MSASAVIDRNWANVVTAVTGAASASISGEILTCTSVVGESAKATKFVYLLPGEILKVRCMARRTSGVDATSGKILVFKTGGVILDFIRVVSSDWREYTLTYVHPLSQPAGASVGVEFGVFTADAGTVEFIAPSLEIDRPRIGALRTLACGLITLASGVPSINAGFTNHGIRAQAYNAGTKTLTITVDRSSGALYSSPLFFVGMTQNGNGIKIEPKAGSYNAVTGTVNVMFADTTTGLTVDIATLGDIFMWFKAEV